MIKYTHQTRDGLYKARILCTDFCDPHYPVVVALYAYTGGREMLQLYSANLTRLHESHRGFDPNDPANLIEYSFWNDVAVDTPIWVSDSNRKDVIYTRHFAKYENGKVYAWNDGRTSHSASSCTDWLLAWTSKP